MRGYVQSLERRLHELEARCHDLEGRLSSLGVDIPPLLPHDKPVATTPSQWHQSGDEVLQDNCFARNALRYRPAMSEASRRMSEPDTSVYRLPDFRDGLTGDNYLGVSSGNYFISSIRGTVLNVLGMEIDLADYMHADLDEPDPSKYNEEPVYNKSYSSFIFTAFSSKAKIKEMDLPPREEGFRCTEWYFKMVNPYLPVLHKPSHMRLVSPPSNPPCEIFSSNKSKLTKMYDDSTFEPTVAEKVIVHCVFALLFWQWVLRNYDDAAQQADLNRRSNHHYHYALGFYPELMASHTLQDVQALAMLSLHMRAFPKPGACWMMTSVTLNLAIELGLHRSCRSWAPTSPKKSLLEVEMRKRIFWSVLVVHILVSGNLGRPMALRENDYDLELPQELDDDLLSEDGLDTSKPGKCGFLIGLQAFKVEPIFIDLFNNIYAVKRSPQTYIETVLRLERRIQKFCDHWPNEAFDQWKIATDETRIWSCYMRMWPLEFRLLLRHPSLSLTSSTEFNNENLNICLESAKEMLAVVKELQRLRSLDSNWQTGALYLLAISTTLFGFWERRDELVPAAFESLKEDMEAWLSIMGDIGMLLGMLIACLEKQALNVITGSGKRLQQAVRATVDNTLNLLSRHLASKTSQSTSSTRDCNGPSHHSTTQPHESYDHQNHYHSYSDSTSTNNPSTEGHARRSSYVPTEDASMNHPLPQYSTYAYPEPSTTNLPTFPIQQSPGMPYILPPQHQPQHPQQQQQHATPQQATAAAATAFMFQNPAASSAAHLYQSPPTAAGAPVPQQYPQHPAPPSIQAQWRHFAGNMASSLEPQDFLNPAATATASALMQLGGRQGESGADGAGAGGEGLDVHGLSGGLSGPPWPQMFLGGT